MRALIGLAVALTVMPACSLTRVTDKQTLTRMAPSMMANPDVDAACEIGVTMSPLVSSLGKPARVDALGRQTKAATGAYLSQVLTATSAGMCSDFRVWNTEILRNRAVHDGQGLSATDLLEVEKREHERAARRYEAAWTALEAAFPDAPIGEACPAFDDKLGDDLVYMLGLSSGVLAVLHDRPTGGSVGVSLTIPRAVERAASCLDDDKWWGVPGALRAAIWSSVPGSGPERVDPLAVLEEAAAKGDAAGVRLARAFQVQTLSSLGEEDRMATAIADHAASLQSTPPHPDWQMLDRYATLLIRHESDKRWAAAEGYRTPMGQFGALPGVTSAEDAALDDLLNSLLPQPEAPTEEDAPNEETP